MSYNVSMKKFVLTLLLSAFVFVSVHDYIIVSIDQDTQSELYLHDSGQISEVCDVTETHQALHDALMAIDIVFYPLKDDGNLQKVVLEPTNFLLSSSPQSIYHPPTV